MLRLLRRCRALAVTLLLAAPGLGGTWLSVAHPCPVDMPWLAQGEHAEHAAQPGHGHEDAPAGSTTSCHCVGTCQGGTAALMQLPAEPAVIAAEDGWNDAPSAPDHLAPAQPRLRRHPPATAPPLA